MAFGDALLGIQDQLLDPADFDLPGPSTSTDLIPASQVRQAPVLPIEEQARNAKGFGKFFSTLGDVIERPDVRKALGAVGVALDPRGVGGALGSLGIQFAEGDAQAAFRSDIAAGGDPNRVATPGLSQEGRQAVLGEQATQSELTRREEQRLFENELQILQREEANRRISISEQNAALREREVEAREEGLDIQRLAQEDKVRLAEFDQKLEASRTKFQNLRDAASARASDALAESRKEGEIVDVNKQRVSLLEELTNQKAEVETNLRQARSELEAEKKQAARPGVRIRRGARETAKEERLQAQLKVSELERQLAEIENLQGQTLQDFSADLSGQSNFSTVQTRSTDRQQQQRGTGNIQAGPGELPVIRSAEEFSNAGLSDGDEFFMPDPATGRPVKARLVNGVPRRVIE